MRGGKRSLVASASRARPSCSYLEADGTREHEALEGRAVADVRGREVVVLLRHPLGLGQDVRRHEPAAAELPAIDRLIAVALRDQLAAQVIVPAAEIQLVVGEAIQAFEHLLAKVTQLRLAERAALG